MDLAKAALFTFRRMAQVACAAVGLLGNLACGGEWREKDQTDGVNRNLKLVNK